MRFVRASVSHTTNRVVGVVEQDTPFTSAEAGVVTIAGEECETTDLGVVEDQKWTDRDGKPCGLTQHILERLESGDAGIQRLHDVPCTLDGIRARLRERGPAGIPVRVRAWLATVLPSDQVDALGIARGLPISALKACEAIRTRRDPHGGSRMAYFELVAQCQHETRRAKIERGIRRRTEKEAAIATAAAQAWQEMQTSIENGGGQNGQHQAR